MRLQRKKSKKPLFITLGVVLVVVGVVVFFLFFKPSAQNTDNNSVDAVATDEQSGAKNIKDSPIAANPQNDAPAEDIPASTVGGITITQLDQVGGIVRATATVTDFKTQKCVYSFTIDGGKPVVREQTGDCTALTVAQDYFDRIGRYTLTVTAYSDSDKLTTSQEINVL